MILEDRMIRVVVRLRSCPEDKITNRVTPSGLSVHTGRRETEFKVSKVYSEYATQAELFEGECLRLVEAALHGRSGILLAYGQTGSGKTHTILGEGGATKSYDQRGLLPRSIEKFFEAASDRRRQGTAVDVRLSCLEVYNETLVDLLDPNTDARLAISESGDGTVQVKGLTMANASTAGEALQLLYEAEINRAVCSHSLNLNSSRSHLVVTAYIRSSSSNEDSVVNRSKLNFVDLAGSERIEATGAGREAKTSREASYINKSLTFLEQVVVALADARRDHVPYRSSKLTHLLKDSLGGSSHSQATLVACVWPQQTHLQQTMHTLRFAARMGRVQYTEETRQATANSTSEEQMTNITTNAQRDKLLISKLENEVDRLRKELATTRKQAIGKVPVGASDVALTAQDLAKVRDDVDAFLENSSREPPVGTIDQVRAVYAALRDCVVKIRRPPGTRRGQVAGRATPAETRREGGSDDAGTIDQSVVEKMREFETELESCVPLTQNAKGQVKRAAAEVNAAKRTIDELLGEINENEDDNRGQLLAQKLSEVKAKYRTAFKDLEWAKNELSRIDARKRYLVKVLMSYCGKEHADSFPRPRRSDSSPSRSVSSARRNNALDSRNEGIVLR